MSIFSSTSFYNSSSSYVVPPPESSDDGIPTWVYAVIPFISFFGELVDSSIGMGYGTTLVPVLMTPAFHLERKTIVQSVLVSELCTGLLATIFHLLFRNVNFGCNPNKILPNKLVKCLKLDKNYTDEVKKEIEKEGLGEEALEALVDEYIEDDQHKSSPPVSPVSSPEIDPALSPDITVSVNKVEEFDVEGPTEDPLAWYWKAYLTMKRLWTRDSQVVTLLVLFGVVGTIISTIINAKYGWSKKQKYAIKMYVAVMVLCMGLCILVFTTFKFLTKYAWWKIAILGLVTGFNKGISGGGYGPIAVSGQMICGRPQKNAIASTSTAEAIISLSGIICSLSSNAIQGKNSKEQYSLVPYLIIGSCTSTPFAAYFTRIVKTKALRYIVGIATTLLGVYSIIAAVLSYKGIWSGAE
ncbi:sulfite exporter TauE/SafE family protein [Pelomyxa schiedti]|nr:sulfite exporter TauE/SafE family protein [Pelomyxa schiedti]KAH3746234.1 sulfite exporter TauE/SafE family protein [Pelomyxa schiedti]